MGFRPFRERPPGTSATFSPLPGMEPAMPMPRKPFGTEKLPITEMRRYTGSPRLHALEQAAQVNGSTGTRGVPVGAWNGAHAMPLAVRRTGSKKMLSGPCQIARM